MDRYKQNIQNTKEIISLVHILDEIITNEDEKKIIKWAKEDIKEISTIQNILKKMSLLKYAYMNKQELDVTKLKKYIEEKQIFKIYNVINVELNNWRDINMCIQTCYNKIKIS